VIPKRRLILAGLVAGSMIGLPALAAAPAFAAAPVKTAIPPDVSAAIAKMGKALQAQDFSFQARTIRVYAGPHGEMLHIEHHFKVTVHRPDHLRVEGSGDDGARALYYDGKAAVLATDGGKTYLSIPVPNTIDGMMQVVMGHFGVDFPLADFLTSDPGQSMLSGVTGGEEVNTVTIDGVACQHLLLTQPPGMSLELWLENNDQSLPRRLIVTYKSLPGQPNFVAEMSDWNFSIHPTDADFTFQPPAGAQQIPLAALEQQMTGAKP
jgi:hypothetical protein